MFHHLGRFAIVFALLNGGYTHSQTLPILDRYYSLISPAEQVGVILIVSRRTMKPNFPQERDLGA